MDRPNLRELAEQNLALNLERALKRGGSFSEQELADCSLFCRVVEAETGGGPYAILRRFETINGDLAAAASGLGLGGRSA